MLFKTVLFLHILAFAKKNFKAEYNTPPVVLLTPLEDFQKTTEVINYQSFASHFAFVLS